MSFLRMASRCELLFAIMCAVSTVHGSSTEEADEMTSSLPVCSHDNSVCNILVKNSTDKPADLEQICSCLHAKSCPKSFSEEQTIKFLDDEWFVTCTSLDVFPVCKPGQVSMLSKMTNLDEPMNFLVKCTCPGGYDTNSARWSLEGSQVVFEIRCKDERENPEAGLTKKRTPFHDSPQSFPGHHVVINFESSQDKRGRKLNSFYKRGQTSMDHHDIYRQSRSGLSAFYKRGLDLVKSFYKRAPFHKRERETRSQPVRSKRSLHFYKRAPFRDLTAFYKRDYSEDGSLDFEKKNMKYGSFYKRGSGNGKSSFYKRGKDANNSFYKRFADGILGIDAIEDLQPEVDSELKYDMSLDKKDTGGDWSFYKRNSLVDLPKRSPRYEARGPFAFYKRRGDAGTSSFYKRGLGSGRMSFYK